MNVECTFPKLHRYVPTKYAGNLKLDSLKGGCSPATISYPINNNSINSIATNQFWHANFDTPTLWHANNDTPICDCIYIYLNLAYC